MYLSGLMFSSCRSGVEKQWNKLTLDHKMMIFDSDVWLSRVPRQSICQHSPLNLLHVREGVEFLQKLVGVIVLCGIQLTSVHFCDW